MRRGLLVPALYLLVLACHPEAAPTPASSPPLADAAPSEPERLELPPVPAEPPAPTAALPPGTPTQEGFISRLVAIDGERAIVTFFIPGAEPPWWLALMRRDGSLAWVHTMTSDLGNTEEASGITILGDTVSLVTSGSGRELELQAFSLGDGKQQFHASLGKAFPSAAVSDATLRVDVSLPSDARRGDPDAIAEVVASSSTGVLWRAKVPGPSFAGPDPTFVGDVIVVRSGSGKSHDATWTVLARKDGKRIGQLSARVQSCSDGVRWFLVTGEGLVAVDPRKLRTRLVSGPLELPGLPGPWVPGDCVVVDGAPVALVSREHHMALVAFDGESFAVRGHVEFGEAALGYTTFDPLPAHVHAMVLAPAITDDGARELLLANLRTGRPLERWRSVEELSFPGEVIPWRGGYVLPTRRTVTIVDGRSGAFEGRAMIPEVDTVSAEQLVGDTLWLPPFGLRLGARAPRVVDLSAEAPDDVRRATLADLRPASTASKAP